jgi:Outer membrane protein beta-barrel domain
MSHVRCRTLLAPLVLILGIAGSRTDTLARDTEKSWEFGANALVSRYAAASTLDNGFGFGVRGGYHPKAIHELEGSLDRASADSTELAGVSYDITKLNFDYLRIFLVKGHEKMTPFASFGLGLTNVDNGSKSSTATSYRTGGGFKYFFKPRVGLRFDVKVYRWHGDNHVLPGQPFFSMDATLGATFLVGGAK